MLPIDRLNIYAPRTRGFLIVGNRTTRWWIPGKIMGRVRNQYRRFIDEDGNSWFIEHEQQFQVTQPFVRPKQVHLGRI